MKKKLVKIIIMLVLITSILFSMTACGFLSGIVDSGTSTGTGTDSKTTYKVTLVVPESESATVYQGLTSSNFVKKDSKTGKYTLVKPSVTPKKVGQEFVRWCSDEKCTKELAYGTALTADISIYPQWKAAQVQVIVMNELEDDQAIVFVDYGKTLADYSDTFTSLTMNGYTFMGWFSDYGRTELCDLDAPVTEDMTVYAGWKASTYAINYRTNGGALPKDAPTEYGLFSDVTLPTCTKDGYIFCGWYENSAFDGDSVTKIVEGTRGIKTYYAKFLCNIADIKYYGEEDNIVGNTVNIEIPAVATVLDLEEFLTFPDGSSYTVLSGQEEASLAFTANEGDTYDTNYTLQVTSESESVTKTYVLIVTQFSSRYITLEFYNGSVKFDYDYSSYQVGEKVNKPASEPVPATGYTFAYWGDAEGVEYDFSKTVKTETLTLYAQYDAIEYTVTYAFGRGTNSVENPTVYTVEDEYVFEEAVPDYADYEFDGWYDGDTKVSGIELGSTGNLALRAKYVLKNESLVDFTGVTEITKEQFPDFLAWATYNRMESVTIKVTGATTQAELEEYMSDADGGLTVDGKYVTFNYSMEYKEGEYYNLSGLTLGYAEGITDADGFTAEWPGTENSQIDSGYHLSATGRVGFDDFAIDYIATELSVTDTEQLVYAIEHGYRPVPTVGSPAETVYNEAKDILNEIIDNGMSDYEKVLAIYEYIIKTVSYDDELFDAVCEDMVTATEAADYASFYLEGSVLNHIAVCDGISKEFMLLCRIEGIIAVQVEGISLENGTGHAWNKVYLAIGEEDPAWYLVDCTSGNMIIPDGEGGNNECLTHNYFLITDVDMENGGQGYEATADEEFNYPATTVYNYYANTEYTVDDDDYTFTVSSNAELAIFFKYIVSCIPEVGTAWACADVEFTDQYNPTNEDYGAAYGTSGIDSTLYRLSLTNLNAKHVIFTFVKVA